MTTIELILVFDTDAYSGNFERELASFCTGEVGGSGKGRREAADFHDAREEAGHPAGRPYADLVLKPANDHGSEEAGHIWPTPGRVNDGSGCLMDAADFDALPDRASRHPFPAYESVAIHLAHEPDAVSVALFRSRADEYARTGHGYDRHRTPFRILGMRLVTRTTTVTEASKPL